VQGRKLYSTLVLPFLDLWWSFYIICNQFILCKALLHIIIIYSSIIIEKVHFPYTKKSASISNNNSNNTLWLLKGHFSPQGKGKYRPPVTEGHFIMRGRKQHYCWLWWSLQKFKKNDKYNEKWDALQPNETKLHFLFHYFSVFKCFFDILWTRTSSERYLLNMQLSSERPLSFHVNP